MKILHLDNDLVGFCKYEKSLVHLCIHLQLSLQSTQQGWDGEEVLEEVSVEVSALGKGDWRGGKKQGQGQGAQSVIDYKELMQREKCSVFPDVASPSYAVALTLHLCKLHTLNR